MKKNKKIYSGIFFIILAILYLIGTRSIQDYNAFVSTGVNSASIPKVLGVLLLVLGIAQTLEGKRMKNINNKQDNKSRENYKEVISTFVLLIVYALLLEPLGFILSSIIFLIGQMLILTISSERKSSVKKIILLSIIFCLIVYFIFTRGLSLILPRGLINI